MIGRTLAHYRVLEKLGEGGMGEVFLAEDTRLKRQVALKVLPAELATAPERLERFQREAETLAALSHPNIVTIFSVEEAEGVHFLTMERVKGQPLGRLIPAGGMALERLFDITIPLAGALAAAHEKGVTHRDLKPSNVIVAEDGLVKILDFGLAKLRSEDRAVDASEPPTEPLTREGMVLGTLPYMSPEQVQGRELDHRSDIFSLGIMLYEMATGQRPFGGETSADLVSSILRDTPSSVNELRGETPHQLGRIVRHCLERDPKDRFQTARDVYNELKSLEQEVQSGPRAATKPEGPARYFSRLRWVTGAALVLLVAGGYFVIGRPGGRSRIERDLASIRSLAVLPLENLSGDPEQEYFADGMTEALITDLSKIGALKVISRTSVMQYKGARKPLSEIAEELGVDAVVEGSVLKAGDRVRINVQLVDARSDEHLWADSFARDLRDILALQSEVARSVAQRVEIELTSQEESLLAATRRVDPEAHEAYLKGRFFLSQLTQESFEKARELMQEAIARDPTYAPAHAGLADCYLHLQTWGYMSRVEGLPLAKATVLEALELDENLVEAHAVRAEIDTELWNWRDAEQGFRRAIELNPSHAEAHYRYASLLSYLERHDEAIAQGKLAVELEPLSVEKGVNLGLIYRNAREYEEAEHQIREVLSLHPNALFAEWALGVVLQLQGRTEEAIQTFLGRQVPTAGVNFALGYTYGVAGRHKEPREVLDFLLKRSQERFVPPAQIAYVYIGLGEKDKAFEWLEEAYEQRGGWLNLMQVDPWFDPLRDDPRFHDLLLRMNFPESPSEH